jgi:hypothetical protein
MLEEIHEEGDDGSKFIEPPPRTRPATAASWASATAFTKTTTRAPRSSRQQCDKVLAQLHKSDPLLDIAKRLEEIRPRRRLLHRAQALSERRFLQRHHHARHRHPARHVHRHVRHRPHAGLDRQLQGSHGVPKAGSAARARSTPDRFLFNIVVDYPSETEEREIIRRVTSPGSAKITPLMSAEDIIRLQEIVKRVPVGDHVIDFAAAITRATRPKEKRHRISSGTWSPGVPVRAPGSA